MKNLFTIATLITIARFMKNKHLAEATCGADVPLCRQAPQIIDNQICISQEINWSMDSCCSAESVDANSCPGNPEPTCRTIDLSTPFSVSADECCAELEFTFQWSLSPTSCCRTCSCFGDPNCISFNDEFDSWIICDGRMKNENAVIGKELFCPIKKGICEQQLDHVGKPCVYTDNGKETVDKNGSPCQTGSKEPATMSMYKVKDFEALLTLGDRGAITRIAITNGDETYYADSTPCASTNFPWRDTPGAKNPPNDPNWLPNSWKMEPVNGGKLWIISGLKTGIEIKMRCVFNRYGTSARINVDSLADPLKSRPDESGVCVTGEIDKMQSTYQHTNDIKKFCRSSQSQIKAIQYFCPGYSLSLPAKCMKSFCNTITNGTAAARNTCVAQIMKYQNDQTLLDGWERVWCAYNILPSQDPAECTSGDCLQCMYDVYDFDWGEAVLRWSDFNKGGDGTGSTGPCIPYKQLNASLADCENGITFQYLDTDAVDGNGNKIECWVDYISIPEGRNICGGNSISFTYPAEQGSNEINFFDKKIRIKQCNNQALCATSQPDECIPEFGVSGKIKLIPDAVTNRANLYWQLIREGKLVCEPSDPECLTDAYGTNLPTAKCTGCDYCPTK